MQFVIWNRTWKPNDVSRLYEIIFPATQRHQQCQRVARPVDAVNIKQWRWKMSMSSKRTALCLPSDYITWIGRLQPESFNAATADDSRQSVVDSVMIDNQADYDRIFRGKARLPRSPSRQEASSQANEAPSSSSAGFAIQAPLNNEVLSGPSSAVSKPKSSHSVSPPPQVTSLSFSSILSRAMHLSRPTSWCHQCRCPIRHLNKYIQRTIIPEIICRFSCRTGPMSKSLLGYPRVIRQLSPSNSSVRTI